MEADLKASETVKVELQQAHAEAHSLMVVRQDLMAKVQKLNQDIQKSHAGVQKSPCSDVSTKQYKSRIPALQVMEKNYNLMMREIGKLRAELTNAGGSYSNTGGYEENDTAGKHSVGQNACGVPQGRALSGGGSAGNAPTRPGYDAPARGSPANYALRNTSHDAPRVAAGHDNSKVAPQGNPGDAAANIAALGSSTCGCWKRCRSVDTDCFSIWIGSGNITQWISSGTLWIETVWINSGTLWTESLWISSGTKSLWIYSGTKHLYGSTQALNPYGLTQAPNPYGSTQA